MFGLGQDRNWKIASIENYQVQMKRLLIWNGAKSSLVTFNLTEIE